MGKKAKPPVNEVQEKIHTWKEMVAFLKDAPENELWELLKYETKHRKRLSTALRLYGAAAKKRYDRERKEIMSALSK